MDEPVTYGPIEWPAFYRSLSSFSLLMFIFPFQSIFLLLDRMQQKINYVIKEKQTILNLF